MSMNALLAKRLKPTDKESKMSDLAALSSSGHLSSFSGVFQVNPLTREEESSLEAILTHYKMEDQETITDLPALVSVTSELKAINNQAAILHGERIKQAQQILKRYRDGAFSAWLLHVYGNRQTPYNFLHYYEFHKALSILLQQRLDKMPRQAAYTLASRSGPLERKEEVIRNYKGERKQELLEKIRAEFPLSEKDARGQDVVKSALLVLRKLKETFASPLFTPDPEEKKELRKLLKTLLES